MNLCCKLSIAIAVVFTISINTSSAQYNNYVAGASAGTFVYQGDLVPGNIGGYKTLHPAIQVYGDKWVNPYFQLQASFSAGKIEANDADYNHPAWKKDRNLRFQTSIHEFTGRLVFSPFGNIALTPDKRLYPYIFAGTGVAFIKVKRDWSGMSDSALSNAKMAANLAADSAHTLPSALLSIPIGAGINYAISPHISLFGEASYHLPATDYLDGFSYIADNSKKDNYYMINIGINYTFLKSKYTRCPRLQ